MVENNSRSSGEPTQAVRGSLPLGATKLTGRYRNLDATGSGGTPLVVAIHGGTYTSLYFDLPGYSLLDRAALNGISVVALDRPNYGGSIRLAPEASSIEGQATYIRSSLLLIWEHFGRDKAGLVLIGHSIGAAIAAKIAADPGELPLLGLAISGLGLEVPPEHPSRGGSPPESAGMFVEIPVALKAATMFGPPASFDGVDMPRLSEAAHAPAPIPELHDITTVWPAEALSILGRIAVPVHYRQAEFDRLWLSGPQDVRRFADALTRAPLVDAQRIPGTGHCIDFHHAGAALHLQQLGFALQCANS
jgi:pimeloyl-ACP methyl ester carboxylesterase